jgi:hypothetical protein
MSRQRCLPRKSEVSTKRTRCPRRAARDMICWRFVGSGASQSWLERQTIEKPDGPPLASAAVEETPSRCMPGFNRFPRLALLNLFCTIRWEVMRTSTENEHT